MICILIDLLLFAIHFGRGRYESKVFLFSWMISFGIIPFTLHILKDNFVRHG